MCNVYTSCTISFMFSMYQSYSTQHQDKKKMKSERLSSGTFFRPNQKLYLGKDRCSRLWPHNRSRKSLWFRSSTYVSMVQIFKYSWQNIGKSMKIMIFKSYGKHTSKSEIQTAVSLDCMSLALKPSLCAFYFVVQNEGNSTEKHITTRHVATTACAHDQSM